MCGTQWRKSWRLTHKWAWWKISCHIGVMNFTWIQSQEAAIWGWNHTFSFTSDKKYLHLFSLKNMGKTEMFKIKLSIKVISRDKSYSYVKHTYIFYILCALKKLICFYLHCDKKLLLLFKFLENWNVTKCKMQHSIYECTITFY